ncbi:MAG: GspH/FimT family pseudopilin [Methylophilus sp.]|uniref:GspH/FimT family pseudopilin n=1 Tax=Methylophilus sp. TaxID=29541 RepID=UPI003F9FA860
MQQQGFTLIELVVTVVVLMAVSMLAIPAFQSSLGNSQIRTVAESIKNGLQQARAEAIKRNASIKFTLQSNSSWQLGCQTVTDNCPANISAKSAAEGSSANIQVTTDNNTAVFTSFGTRDPAIPAALSRVDITNLQVNSSERRALRILLAAGGYTKLCDPSVTATGDARKC